MLTGDSSILPSKLQEVCLGPLEAIEPGTGVEFRVGDRSLAVFHDATGAVLAVQAKCPHAGADLVLGSMGRGTVICPLHGYRFDLGSGACRTDPTLRLRTFPVRIVDGQVWVTLPEPVRS